jgi:hypothetical protein
MSTSKKYPKTSQLNIKIIQFLNELGKQILIENGLTEPFFSV